MSSRFEFEAIGTHWQIDINTAQNLAPEKESEILRQIKERIDIFDKDYSRFRDDSLVTEMSKNTGEYILPDDAKIMMDIYHDLYIQTGGLMTPLIGKVMEDAGYDAKYTLKQQRALSVPPSWEDALEYDFPKLTVKLPALLDFGAAGKGYLIDIVGEVIEKNGVSDYCIDAGGDIRYRIASDVNQNKNPLQVMRIALEDPQDFKKAVGIASILNQSLCGSAGSRRKWENFHHIIDPKKLTSVKDVLATWVVADSTILADALASAIFFVPPSTLVGKYKFEYFILYADRSADKSPNFPGQSF
jgi:thiamine biosynthesis lipoprotein